MATYELTTEQAALDQQAVGDLFAEIQDYLRAADDEVWNRVFQDQLAFIDGVYDTFAPEVNAEARSIGRLLGAAGLTLAVKRYGNDEQSPRLYGGTVENSVLATYHHAGHPRQVIENMFRYAAAVNREQPGTYTNTDFALFPGEGAFHDLSVGNGRENDERQSGRLLSGYATRIGI
ncbi:MAG TPA: hypothetical protein VKQ34_04845, partial [Candidatus Saccharimonadales bacterium]|nr:hypothetical protein [Candidatus Saccharimonadales bacterium]